MVCIRGQNSIKFYQLSCNFGIMGGVIFRAIYLLDSKTMCCIFSALHNIYFHILYSQCTAILVHAIIFGSMIAQSPLGLKGRDGFGDCFWDQTFNILIFGFLITLKSQQTFTFVFVKSFLADIL